MPRPRHRLEEAVRLTIEANPGWTNNQVLDHVLELVQVLSTRIAPEKTAPEIALSTINRIRKRHEASSDRFWYQLCRWPASFEAGLLPWEAGLAYFDLLRFFMAPLHCCRWLVGFGE